MTPGSNDTGPLEYELYAVLIHLDLMNFTSFGHYVCATKTADGLWLLYNDKDVDAVSSEDIMQSNAYMVWLAFRSAL